MTHLPALEGLIERDYWLAMAKHYIEYIGPCPWNPFPRTSHWGRAIDEAYQRQMHERKALRSLTKLEG